jgi:DNA-binding GntR family transcriptional regulator
VSQERIDRGKTTLAHRVEELLRKEIVRGERPSGSRLNEVEIAAAYDVSRGPVREAMQRLARDGLVVLEAHRGAFVKSLDRDEVLDLFEVRAALEAEAAGLAAQKISDDGVVLLRRMQEQSVRAHDETDDHSFPEGFDLHDLIGQLAGNRRLTILMHQVNGELRLVRSRSGQSAERAQRALHEHDELIERLALRDVEGARTTMRAHLDASLANTLALMFPDGPPTADLGEV